MILYNCKSLFGGPGQVPSAYRIVKWSADLTIEAEYTINFALLGGSKTCTCPAWPRKSHCKHIDMLERFRWREYVDTDWFWNADTEGWHKPLTRHFELMEPGSTPFPSGPETSLLTGPEAAEGAVTPSPSAVRIHRRQIK